jgi:hypothetical protein
LAAVRKFSDAAAASPPSDEDVTLLVDAFSLGIPEALKRSDVDDSV